MTVDTELFQHGVAVPEGQIRSTVTRDRLLGDEVDLTPAGRQRNRRVEIFLYLRE